MLERVVREMITRHDTWEGIKDLNIEDFLDYLNALENAFERACEDLAILDEIVHEDDYETSFEWKAKLMYWTK